MQYLIGCFVVCPIILLLLYFLWNNFFYVAGGALGIVAILCALAALGSYNESKMTQEQWLENENKRKAKKPEYVIKPYSEKPERSFVIGIAILSLVCCGLSYASFQHQNEKEARIIAEQEQKKVEMREKKISEENAKYSNFNEDEKKLYEQKFNEYRSQIMDPATARTKAIADVEADTAAKKKALQEQYDKQAQYEEWVAWQAEQEKIAQQKDEEERKNQLAQAEKERQQLASQQYTEVSIYEIMKDLDANAARANKKYKDKNVKIVGGIVTNIESDGDFILIDMPDRWNTGDIQCFPKNNDVKSRIFELSNDQRITVYGKITKVGEIMGYSLDMVKIE